MCFATVILRTTNSRVVTMHHNKDTQKEIVILEAVVWVFWAFVFFTGYLFAQIAFQINKGYDLTMINLFDKGMQVLSERLTRYEQLRVNAENEHQAMSCGAFSPRFLTRIKRCNHETDKKNEKK